MGSGGAAAGALQEAPRGASLSDDNAAAADGTAQPAAAPVAVLPAEPPANNGRDGASGGGPEAEVGRWCGRLRRAWEGVDDASWPGSPSPPLGAYVVNVHALAHQSTSSATTPPPPSNRSSPKAVPRRPPAQARLIHLPAPTSVLRAPWAVRVPLRATSARPRDQCQASTSAAARARPLSRCVRVRTFDQRSIVIISHPRHAR